MKTKTLVALPQIIFLHADNISTDDDNTSTDADNTSTDSDNTSPGG